MINAWFTLHIQQLCFGILIHQHVFSSVGHFVQESTGVTLNPNLLMLQPTLEANWVNSFQNCFPCCFINALPLVCSWAMKFFFKWSISCNFCLWWRSRFCNDLRYIFTDWLLLIWDFTFPFAAMKFHLFDKFEPTMECVPIEPVWNIV